MMSALGKDLIGLEGLTRAQIQLALDTAEPFKEVSERAIKKVPTLRGQTSPSRDLMRATSRSAS